MREGPVADEPGVLLGGDCAPAGAEGIDFLWRSQERLRYWELKFDVVGRVSHWQ